MLPRLTCALFALALSAPPACLAQGPGQAFAALTGGATLSDIYGGATSSDSRWGGTAGLLLGYNTWRSAVGLEGSWVQKGGGDTRIDYIELPLTFGAVAGSSYSPTRGRFYSGISVAFKVSCSSDDIRCDNVNGTEWGWPIGIQLGRRTSADGFTGIDVRYTFGLSDLIEDGGGVNRPWQFRLMLGKVLQGDRR